MMLDAECCRRWEENDVMTEGGFMAGRAASHDPVSQSNNTRR